MKRSRPGSSRKSRSGTEHINLVWLASVLACVFLVSGCGYPTSEPVEDAEVYGTWISRGPAGQTATLVFAEDGTFQGTDLPGDVFFSPGDKKFPDAADWEHLTMRHGTWTTKWNTTNHWAYVVLDTQFISGETLNVFGSGLGKTLSAFIGDPDSWVRLVFERADRPGVEATANTG